MRHVRWITPVIALLALVGTAVIVAGPGSAGAATTRRFSAGLITVDGQSTLGVLVTNHTSHKVHAKIRLANATGFSSTGPASITVPPGGYNAASFTCTNVGSCGAEPIVTTTAGGIPTGTYVMYTASTTPEQINITPGEWKSF